MASLLRVMGSHWKVLSRGRTCSDKVTLAAVQRGGHGESEVTSEGTVDVELSGRA